MKNQGNSKLPGFLLLLVFISVISSFGCSIIRKNQIKSELEKLEPQKTASAQKLSEINNKIQSLENDVKTLQSNIKKRTDLTLSYMKENAGTVACMASVGYSLGDDNLFSKDVNDFINTVSVVCAVITVFSEDFRNNVDKVVNTIDQSDRAIKTWKIQIAEINDELKTYYQVGEQEKKLYSVLDNKIKGLKSELGQMDK